MRGRALLIAGLVVVATSASGRAEAAAPPEISLYTFGAGEDPFTRFGHGALCVLRDGAPQPRCFNYGTADFSTPVPLGWAFLRGRATFWVSTTSEARMIDSYMAEDRTIYRQVLPLAPGEAVRLAALLENDLRPENRTYIYHHFDDNCSTRLRDHIDAATGGRLRAGADSAFGPSFRELAMRGFGGDLPLQAAAELALGRAGDRRPTLYEAMFLPDILREEVTKRLGAPPDVVYARQAPPVGGSTTLARWFMVVLGAALALLAGMGLSSRHRGVRRATLIVIGVALGLPALAFDVVCAVSVLPELTRNELLLVLLPTDLALTFLKGRALRVYLLTRLALLALVALGALTGVLIQPLWAPMAAVGLPLAAAAALEARRARAALPTVQPLLGPVERGEPG